MKKTLNGSKSKAFGFTKINSNVSINVFEG